MLDSFSSGSTCWVGGVNSARGAGGVEATGVDSLRCIDRTDEGGRLGGGAAGSLGAAAFTEGERAATIATFHLNGSPGGAR